MGLTTQQFECLVVALLAVNGYSLEKVHRVLPGLRAAGLADTESAAQKDLPAVIAALTMAGYDRGRLTWLLAERLRALVAAARCGDLDALADAVERRDEETAMQMMLRVHGIGPKVARSAWMLLTS